MEFLNNNPNKGLLQRTIRRLKNQISDLKNNSLNSNMTSFKKIIVIVKIYLLIIRNLKD